MNILVTGGAGFIGSHLCERLLADGHRVTCVDNFLTGSRANVAGCEGNEKFTLIEHDITQPLTGSGTTPRDFSDIELIYHLACPASPVDYRDVPLQTLMANSVGTKNVLDIAGKFFVPFVFASSSEVYGDPMEHPQQESYFGNVSTLGMRSCYTEGKRFAESLCWNYWRHFQFDLRIVRIFNTYGPRMRKLDGRVIPEFFRCALLGEPLPVHGNGTQTRSFCYISDMVDGLVAAGKHATESGGALGPGGQPNRRPQNTGLNASGFHESFPGAINLGNPEEVTVKELAEKIIALTGSDSLVSFRDAVENDPARRRPDITVARDLLGFEPKLNLEDGLLLVLESLRTPL